MGKSARRQLWRRRVGIGKQRRERGVEEKIDELVCVTSCCCAYEGAAKEQCSKHEPDDGGWGEFHFGKGQRIRVSMLQKLVKSDFVFFDEKAMGITCPHISFKPDICNRRSLQCSLFHAMVRPIPRLREPSERNTKTSRSVFSEANVLLSFPSVEA